VAKKSCDIYGPDLTEHEAEAAAIAKSGLKCMKGTGATDEAAQSEGDAVSKSELEKFHPNKA